MILVGIKEVDPNKNVTIIPSEKEAITYAIKQAPRGALIIVSSDVVPDALNLVMQFKEEEANELYDMGID